MSGVGGRGKTGVKLGCGKVSARTSPFAAGTSMQQVNRKGTPAPCIRAPSWKEGQRPAVPGNRVLRPLVGAELLTFLGLEVTRELDTGPEPLAHFCRKHKPPSAWPSRLAWQPFCLNATQAAACFWSNVGRCSAGVPHRTTMAKALPHEKAQPRSCYLEERGLDFLNRLSPIL